ncbi:hypothetical protein PC123_g23272 [Phytophthora cactorum]|nr:hypothetical protein PC123_g23272 [Phytophthora cactorum]
MLEGQMSLSRRTEKVLEGMLPKLVVDSVPLMTTRSVGCSRWTATEDVHRALAEED